MDYTHYMFAFFVFLLVCGCIWLFGRVVRRDKKQDTGTYEKEQRLFKLFQNVEDMMSGFEEYVEETKKEMDSRIARMERISAQAESAVDRKTAASSATNQKPAAASKQTAAARQSAAAKMPEAMPSVRDLPVEEAIPRLLEQGMTQQQIAKHLGISNREVTLIMGIKKIGGTNNKS